MTNQTFANPPYHKYLSLIAISIGLLCLGCGSSSQVPVDKTSVEEAPLRKPASDDQPEENSSNQGEPTAEGSESVTGDSSEEASSVRVDPNAPFVLGDLIDPFKLPTLEELEAEVEWVDSPVVDPLNLLREQKEMEPALISEQEALKLRNDSDEANEKILSALSSVPDESGAGVDFDAVLNRSFQQDLRAMNPLLASSVSEQELSSIVSAGLFSYDWKMNPFALSDYVVSWQTSKDRKYDKIILRDDLTWSDGEPLTAHDVVFSYKTILSSQVPVPAVRQGTDQIAWIEAYDDHTLVYFHKEPSAVTVWNLNFPLIPKHVYGESIYDDPTLRKSDPHIEAERNPVTGGAYEIASRKRGREIVLRRRESYYMHKGEQVREKPFFESIRFRIIEDANTSLLTLKTGDIHETLIGAEQWLTQTGDDRFYKTNTKARGPEWTFFYIGWNLKEPMFQDVRVRKALAHAMNYEEMIDDLCYGLFQRCHGMFHPDAWMFPEDAAPLYEYDLDVAEELLDEAGWDDSDGDGIRDKRINGKLVPFEFSLLVSNKPDRIAICNLFREDLDSIGIRCKISPLEAAVFQERSFKKNYQAMMSGWGTGADPYTNKNIFGTGEDRNYGSYSNDRVDELFELAEKEFDHDKRTQMYGEIFKLIFEDQPYMFLFNRSSFYGFSKKLRGYRFSPRGPYSYGPGISSLWMPADN